MKTSEILQSVDIPRHKLYYLEQKGYVVPKRIPMGDLEAREYSDQDAIRIKLIWKYLRKGFKHKVAYEKAMEELELSLHSPGIIQPAMGRAAKIIIRDEQ